MSNQEDFVGRVRSNWQQRAEERTTFRAELRLVPRWMVWVLVTAYFVALAALLHFNLAEPGYVAGRTLRQMIGNELLGIGIVTAIAIPVSAFLMLIGYIGADARRRGMSGLLWVLVSLLVPYLIGVILYFIVRDPLSLDCPQCGSKVNPHFNFCPGCQFNLRPNCPQCRRAVATGAHFCPHCGFKLQADEPAEQVAPAP